MAKFAKTVTVVEVSDILEATDGRSYQVVSLTQPFSYFTNPMGEVKRSRALNPKVTGVTVWDTTPNGRVNPNFGNFQVEDELMGDIVSRNVVPFVIETEGTDPRAVGSYSTFVEGDTTDEASFERAIVAAFKNAGQTIQDHASSPEDLALAQRKFLVMKGYAKATAKEIAAGWAVGEGDADGQLGGTADALNGLPFGSSALPGAGTPDVVPGEEPATTSATTPAEEPAQA